MSTNPFAPPLAPIEEPRGVDDARQPLFSVAPWKLLLMSVVTLGLYQLYWFHENWRRVRRFDQSEIWPVPRAIFGLFYCHALFVRMREIGQGQGVTGAPEMGALAIAWIAGTLAWRLPAPWMLVGMATWIVLLPVQAYANRVNAAIAPDGSRNGRLTWLNWIAVVIGGGFLVLVVIGLTTPGEA